MTKVKTAEMASRLGVSQEFLLSLVHSKALKEGKHFINISKGKKRPTYRWDVEEIIKLFNRPS